MSNMPIVSNTPIVIAWPNQDYSEETFEYLTNLRKGCIGQVGNCHINGRERNSQNALLIPTVIFPMGQGYGYVLDGIENIRKFFSLNSGKRELEDLDYKFGTFLRLEKQ